MGALERILVVVDRRMRTTSALERGVALARKSGAQLHLAIFDHQPLIDRAADLVAPEVMQLAKTQYIAERLDWLAAQAAALADHGVRVECDVVWSPVPHEAILSKVLEIKPDMVIKDVHSEPWRQRLIHTPLDWRILRYCPAPVMMVRPSTKYLPRRIAVAVDTPASPAMPNPLDTAIFDAAAQIALYCGAEMHVAHVAMPPVPLHPASVSLSDACAKVKLSEAQLFRDICDAHQVPRECMHLLEGDPASELARLAQRMDIDLLVLGSIYRSATDRFLLGSTTESLISMAECDVLLVKSPEFGEELSRHVDIEAMRNRQLQVA